MVAPSVAHAQPDTGEEAPPTTETVPDELGNSLPRPNAGPSPEDAGDRGGWLQYALLGVMVIAVAAVIGRLVHHSRRDEATDISSRSPGT